MPEELFTDEQVNGMTGSFIVVKEEPPPAWRQPSPSDWTRFINEVVAPSDGEISGVNKLPFAKLSKLYGNTYLQYVFSAYSCNNFCMSDAEFCAYYGNVPVSFFEKKIKHTTYFRKG